MACLSLSLSLCVSLFYLLVAWHVNRTVMIALFFVVCFFCYWLVFFSSIYSLQRPPASVCASGSPSRPPSAWHSGQLFSLAQLCSFQLLGAVCCWVFGFWVLWFLVVGLHEYQTTNVHQAAPLEQLAILWSSITSAGPLFAISLCLSVVVFLPLLHGTNELPCTTYCSFFCCMKYKWLSSPRGEASYTSI